MSVKNDPGERMTAFATVKLCQNAAPITFVIDIVKQI